MESGPCSTTHRAAKLGQELRFGDYTPGKGKDYVQKIVQFLEKRSRGHVSVTVHIQKLCVGIESIEHLAERQTTRQKRQGEIAHHTRMPPKRRDEIVDGGSIYWVIKGKVQVRQRIIEIEILTASDTGKRCKFVLDSKLVPVRPRPKRAFQGWRYLAPEDASPDLDKSAVAAKLPEKMRAELAELGLI